MAFKFNLNFNFKSALRFLFMKALGIILALLFGSLALVFLSYSAISLLATTQSTKEAKIVLVTDHLGKHQTACRVGGLFEVQTLAGKGKNAVKDSHIYCLYPAWPDQLQPYQDHLIKVWPTEKPLVGAPAVEGWGWFILGTVFILGLLMVEFAFLSLLIR